MLRLRSIYVTCQRRATRHFTQGSILRESKPNTAQSSSTSTSNNTSSSASKSTIGPVTIKPTDFNKTILVWTKTYPSKDKVPDRVSRDVMYRAQSKARIKICNWMIVFAVCGFIGSAFSGKLSLHQGDIMMARGLRFVESVEKKKDS